MNGISEYLKTIVIVSITGGIVTSLCGTRRGMDKYVKYAASLIIIFILLQPFTKIDFSNIGSDLSSFLDEHGGEVTGDRSEYNKRISEYSANALEKHTVSELNSKLKLSEGSVEVKFILTYIKEDELEISEIKITLKTITSVVKRDKIEDYIVDKFSNVKYSFTESVN